uniref:TF-B3 domain-containing protein n=1 Tax=Salix viminalis TaxID=40686 RepID=A0A6N2MKI3_SALVM
MENITKKLNITDVERRLLLPENCREDLRSDLEANLKFKDEEGRVWTFRCRASPGGRSKAALYGDWFSFVREKGLRVATKDHLCIREEHTRRRLFQNQD